MDLSRLTPSPTRIAAAACRGWLLLFLTATLARGQAAVREDFEGPEPSWREFVGSARSRIEAQERSPQDPHSGARCEYVQLAAGTSGAYVQFLNHEIPQAPIIAELRPSVWVRADRPSVRLLARVVFPRATNPKTGYPATAIVEGTGYTRVGRWQQLAVVNLPKLVAAQVAVLRVQLRGDVDAREAYVDRLILRIDGGESRTRLWIDDLEVAGAVRAGTTGDVPLEAALPGAPLGVEPVGPDRPARGGGQLSGSMLLAGGRPLFPRIIQHQGESLEFLKARGFNAVRLTAPPTPELLAEARRVGLWLVCPPPRPSGLDDAGQPAALDEIGSQYDGVLAWHLGQGLTSRDLARTKRWAEAVRQADRTTTRRPLVCSASSELLAYSRKVDVLLLDRMPLGTSFEISAYRNWLLERPRLTLPNAHIWATIQTEPAAEQVEQVAALTGGRVPPLGVGNEGPRLLVYSALAAGVRGVYFASRSRLDGDDPQSRWRALLLESLNLELEMVEPWAAGGAFVAIVRGSDPNPDVFAAVLRTDRAQLLLPIWSGSGGQCVPGSAAAGDLTFIVPGIPGNSKAYELTPNGLRLLGDRRTTGGTGVTLDDFGLTSMVVITQDPLALGDATRRAAPTQRAAQLERELAAMKLQTDAATANRLTHLARPSPRTNAALAAARASLQIADTQLSGGNYQEAYAQARRALRSLRALERAEWQAAIGPLGSTVTSPLAIGYTTLPDHLALVAGIESSRRRPNLLPEGNFEDLDRMVRAGWRNYEHTQVGVRTQVDLSRTTRIEGASSLHLAAAPDDPKTAPGLIETPPMWITSPAVPLESGQWVRIHGRVQVPSPITGSLDGLLIIDSLGGEALAERIGKTDQWREFTLYRAASSAGAVSVTFALTGYGEAWIDDVTIDPLVPPTQGPTGPALTTGSLPRRLPPVR
jgi:hypothetical protein